MPAGNDHDVSKSPEMSRAKDLIVPEGVDNGGFFLFKLLEILPTLHAVPQGCSNQSQQHPARKAHQGDFNLLQECKGFQSYSVAPSGFLLWRQMPRSEKQFSPDYA